MVRDDRGQLFTIEGVAAALIMLASAYFVVNATSIYTPGDTHINDMQLETLGSDALIMMNTAPNTSVQSPLQTIAENPSSSGNTFWQMYNNIVNNRTDTGQDSIQFMANVSYVENDNKTVNSSTLINRTRPLLEGEHAVRVTDWVIVNSTKNYPSDSYPLSGCSLGVCNRTVLVEVYLWRD
jgi:hypothetical protein